MKSDSSVTREAAKRRNEGIREEVGRSRETRAMHPPQSSEWNRIKASLGDRSFFTISSRRYAVRHVESTVVYSFFIIRISIQGQTLHGVDMIFPGVGRVTHTSRDVVSLPPVRLARFLRARFPRLVQKFCQSPTSKGDHMSRNVARV